MNTAALSLAQTPPLSVPLRFFLTAPVFAAAAAAVLLVAGPEAMSNRWAPLTLGLTHLITLGFLGSVMVGAVQQLLPVLLGAPVSHPRRVSAVLHGLLSLGTASLAVGLTLGNPGLMHAAAGLLGAGFLLFVAVGGHGLWRSRSRHATTTAMALSVAALAIAVGLGLYLAAGYSGAVPLARHYTDLHVGWGLVGWVGLLIAGVAYQVVPMFQITPEYPRVLMRGLAPVVFGALVLWSLAAGLGSVPKPLALPAAGVIAVALALFAGATLNLQWRRKRRLPDVTLDFWRVAMASLLAAVLVWAAGGLLERTPGLLIGVLFLVGFAMSAVNGMLYKIVPFLVWLHLNNRRQSAGASQAGIPTMRRIIPELAMRRQFRVQMGALATLAGAAVWPMFARPAGLLLLISMGWLGWNLVGALRLYRRSLRAD